MKKKGFLKFAAFLLTLAPTISYSICAFFIVGEPKVPEKLKNTDN